MTVARNLKVTCDIDHNVKATKDGAQHSLSICLCANHHFLCVSPKQQLTRSNVRYYLTLSLFSVNPDTPL